MEAVTLYPLSLRQVRLCEAWARDRQGYSAPCRPPWRWQDRDERREYGSAVQLVRDPQTGRCVAVAGEPTERLTADLPAIDPDFLAALQVERALDEVGRTLGHRARVETRRYLARRFCDLCHVPEPFGLGVFAYVL